MIKNFKWLLLVSLSFVACDNDDETAVEEPITAGSANFSKYVSVGDSFTAGFSNNALFITGQNNSFSNILAEKFSLAGGGEFKIPLMNDDLGGLLFGGSPNPAFGKRLYLSGFSSAGPIIIPVSGTSTTEVFAPNTGGPYNNMGIPGAKSFHLLAPNYGNPTGLATSPPSANPYFVRFASNPSTSVIADAMTQHPTFFSLWVGNMDVLGYATSGGDGSNPITPLTGTAGVGFEATYGALVNTLTSEEAKGVVASIPYVSNLPFFTTVGYNPIPVLSEAQVTALNSAYAPYNGGVQTAKNMGLITEEERVRRTITFTAGTKKPVVIMDEYLTDLTALSPSLVKMRLSTKDDLILLSSQGVSVQTHLAAGNGTSSPIQDRWVLSKDEITELKTATDGYNTAILTLANSKGLAFVDVNAVMGQAFNGGTRFGNYHLSASFITGGMFSLDGIHLSARGNALIANKFLEAINAKYGSNIPSVNLGDYQIQYPESL